MTDAEDTIQTLRRLVIDTKDELMHEHRAGSLILRRPS